MSAESNSIAGATTYVPERGSVVGSVGIDGLMVMSGGTCNVLVVSGGTACLSSGKDVVSVVV